MAWRGAHDPPQRGGSTLKLSSSANLRRPIDLDPQPPILGGRSLGVLERLFLRLLGLSRTVLDDRQNPLLSIGALANFMLLVAIATGVLLLFWYVPSHEDAHASVQRMVESQFPAGLLRSLHRYSSDAALFMALLHGLQILVQRRFAGPRWLPWVTGLGAVFLIWLVGWLGYWLVWDERAQALAVGTAKALDILPIFTDPLGRSFLTDEGVSSLLFFVVFFVHMLLPLLMAIALWLHLSRLARPRWLPSRSLGWWAMGTLLALALIAPATSAAPAAMTVQPNPETIDAWYLLPMLVTDRLGGGAIWLVFLGSSLVLFGLPWWLVRARKQALTAPPSASAPAPSPPQDNVVHPPSSCTPAEPSTSAPVTIAQETPSLRRAPTSLVDPAKCNACETCYRDCPYDAISMIPRSDGRNFPSVAWVDASRCVGCGICAGSCDSSGVGPTWLMAPSERHRMDAWLSSAEPAPIIVLACSHSAAQSLDYVPETGACQDLPGCRVLAVPCAGWVHPLTIERALRRGARGVAVVSCRPGSCAYREGATWTADRIAGTREPELRHDHLDARRVRVLPLDAHERMQLVKEARTFARELDALDVPLAVDAPPALPAATPAARPRSRVMALTGGVIVAALFALATWLPAELPYAAPSTQAPELVVSFKLAGEVNEVCQVLTPEELAALPPHKRIPKRCERTRTPIRLVVWLDGATALDERHDPSGAFGDGASTAVTHLSVPAGEHEIRVALGTATDASALEYHTTSRMTFVEGHRHVLVFDKLGGFSWH